MSARTLGSLDSALVPSYPIDVSWVSGTGTTPTCEAEPRNAMPHSLAQAAARLNVRDNHVRQPTDRATAHTRRGLAARPQFWENVLMTKINSPSAEDTHASQALDSC